MFQLRFLAPIHLTTEWVTLFMLFVLLYVVFGSTPQPLYDLVTCGVWIDLTTPV